MSVSIGTWQGLEALTIHGDAGTATVVPQRGAKIVSLRSSDGREWLTQGSACGAGLTFLEAEMCGWDECAPTIDACDIDGWTYADHGNVWDTAWSVDATSQHLAVSVKCAGPPFSLRRTIAAAQGGFTVRYVVTSLSMEPIRFLWAAHPQFVAGPETLVEIGGVTMTDLYGRGDLAGSIAMVEEGTFAKFWSSPGSGLDALVLRHADGSRLRLSWDAGDIAGAAVWLDGSVYANTGAVALEPSLGCGDSAEDWGVVLAPRACLEWDLNLEFGAS